LSNIYMHIACCYREHAHAFSSAPGVRTVVSTHSFRVVGKLTWRSIRNGRNASAPRL